MKVIWQLEKRENRARRQEFWKKEKIRSMLIADTINSVAVSMLNITWNIALIPSNNTAVDTSSTAILQRGKLVWAYIWTHQPDSCKTIKPGRGQEQANWIISDKIRIFGAFVQKRKKKRMRWPLVSCSLVQFLIRVWLFMTPWTVSKTTTNIYEIHPGLSVRFTRSVGSDSLRPHESQHTRPTCPSPTPGAHSDSSVHVHRVGDAIHPSHPLLSPSPPACPQSLPASGSFPMSQLFAWDGQSTGVSASPSGLTMNTQGSYPSEWTGWISLQSKGLSRVFSSTTVQKHQFFGAQPSS